MADEGNPKKRTGMPLKDPPAKAMKLSSSSTTSHSDSSHIQPVTLSKDLAEAEVMRLLNLTRKFVESDRVSLDKEEEKRIERRAMDKQKGSTHLAMTAGSSGRGGSGEGALEDDELELEAEDELADEEELEGEGKLEGEDDDARARLRLKRG